MDLQTTLKNAQNPGKKRFFSSFSLLILFSSSLILDLQIRTHAEQQLTYATEQQYVTLSYPPPHFLSPSFSSLITLQTHLFCFVLLILNCYY